MQFTEVFPLLLAALVIILVVALYVRLCLRLRRGGGSLTTIGLGTTWELMTKDRRKASETIVKMNAGKNDEDPHIKEADR